MSQHNRGQRAEAIESYREVLSRAPEDSAAGNLLKALTGETPQTAPQDYIVDLFDQYAERYDEHLETLRYRSPEQMRAAVTALAPQRRFQSALDLGCGTGLSAAAFADRVERFIGVDLSAQMLERARTRGLYAELYQEDLVRFLKRTADDATRFDLVLAADVLVYLGDLEALFAALAPRMVSGGWAVLTIERAEGEGYLLRESGRFAHSRDYIHRLADLQALSVRQLEAVQMRRDGQHWVNGDIFILEAS